MTSHLEDVPPPPYTETDVFSASARDAHAADDTSRSTASTNGDVIYTPPLTPRSSHQSNFAGELDYAASSPAAAYFQTRPAPPLSGQPYIVHSITVAAYSTPEALPYPSNLAARDVRLEDWQTFVNYLIPHHSATTNQQVIDRKLRAEGMTATNTNTNDNDDARSQSSSRTHAEAQLNQIRPPVAEEDVTQRRQDMGATVREWNDGFFGPRRVTIRIDFDDGVPPPQMPGAWDRSFDQHAPEQGERSAAAAGEPPSSSSSSPHRPRFGLFGHSFGGGRGGHHGDGGGGFRFAGINVGNDRVSIGNNFVADGRTGSLRIGGIVADSNGISINGTPMFGGGRGAHAGGPGRGPWGPHGWGMAGHRGPPGWPLGSHGSWGGCGRGGAGAPWGGGNWWNHAPRGGVPHEGDQDRGRWEHRGPHPRDRHRSRSSSASTTSSRSSSISSESSVGSLPDYDDLRDSQLPVTKQYLQEWLSHPDQRVTKDKVKQVKEQIKAAKHSPADPASMPFDNAALRREVKELLRAWKDLKREQKRQHRQLRRDMKQQRRQEKRERKQVKRELKQAKREMKRELKEAKREWRRGPFPCGMPTVPAMPLHVPGSDPPFQPPPHLHPRSAPATPDFAHHYPPNPPPPPFDDWWFGESGGSANNKAPGAWPTDGNDGGIDATDAANHAVSRAKYKAAWDMEAKVAEKEAKLMKLHEQIAEEHSMVGHDGAVGASGTAKRGPSDMEVKALAVEKEIEELAKVMEQLRTEADEEFARELAEEEERRARC